MIKKFSNSFNYVPASPIYGYDLKNIEITGEGIINGAGKCGGLCKRKK